MTTASSEWLLTGVPVVERAKREVLSDIASGRVPPTVATFSELHDYVDANEYGGACESDPDTGRGWWDGDESERIAAIDFWNRVQDAIDAWLRAGRP